MTSNAQWVALTQLERDIHSISMGALHQHKESSRAHKQAHRQHLAKHVTKSNEITKDWVAPVVRCATDIFLSALVVTPFKLFSNQLDGQVASLISSGVGKGVEVYTNRQTAEGRLHDNEAELAKLEERAAQEQAQEEAEKFKSLSDLAAQRHQADLQAKTSMTGGQKVKETQPLG